MKHPIPVTKVLSFSNRSTIFRYFGTKVRHIPSPSPLTHSQQYHHHHHHHHTSNFHTTSTAKMLLQDTYTLPAAADLHVHLRNAPGPIASLVTPTIRPSGIDTVFVMPNLAPKPVTSVSEAIAYKQALQDIDPSVNYLMSLYLHDSISPDEIRKAKGSGIVYGVKAYPRGATTNSQWGVVSFEPFDDVLKAMEEVGLVLNLHGEVPSDAKEGVTVMNAEERFLPTLKGLTEKYPKLKIVLEHCTTAKAVDLVKSLEGDNVVGTITAHHLSLLVDDWSANVHHYCKPSAKSPEDRRALLNAVVTSNGKFFLGTDSAPHDITSKKGKGNTAAGVFTQPYALGYVLQALDEAISRGDIDESLVTDEVLAGFFSTYGRKFYGVAPATRNIKLTRDAATVEESLRGGGVEIVPFRSGEKIWSVEWV
ncbi:putative Dihydroorotase [Podospora fimiseda]|uniref:dihydroorotase n=1 Tax=Podospora fimiseda TaxID=252190 RepID=A0AAN7BPA8_9PEZI|nr:putative Dihydroorotase [Podospora fimiseda]